jgi:hypothetical protein
MPLKVVPIGAEFYILWMQQPVDLLCKEHCGVLLEPLYQCGLGIFIWKPFTGFLRGPNTWKAHYNRSGLWGGWSNIIQCMEHSMAWTVWGR